MGHAIFIFGPAGTGKSTFCKSLKEHESIMNRNFKLINLDPSQIHEDTDYIIDIREYITTAEIMEDCDFGPNGSILEAFRELSENIEHLEFEEYSDDYIVFDCPGQIELYMHSVHLVNIVRHIAKYYKCEILYFIESQSLLDIGKFMGNVLCGYVCMSRFDTSMTFVLTKVDMMDKEKVETILDNLDEEVKVNSLYQKIHEIAHINFTLLDYYDEAGVTDLLDLLDCKLQYHDDRDVFGSKE